MFIAERRKKTKVEKNFFLVFKTTNYFGVSSLYLSFSKLNSYHV